MNVKIFPSIVVLETNPTLARFYGKALNQVGCHAYLAETNSDAQALLHSKEKFDVFLCNVQFNPESTLNLLREVKMLEHRTDLQIILVTASGRVKAFVDEFGTSYFLEKPVTVDALHTLIAHIFPTG